MDHSDTDRFSVSARIAEIEALPLADRAAVYELLVNELQLELQHDGAHETTSSEKRG